jgi:hypothetical protein
MIFCINYLCCCCFRAVRREMARFFGVNEETEEAEKLVWLGRRRRLASRRYGDLKPHFSNQSNTNQVSFNTYK